MMGLRAWNGVRKLKKRRVDQAEVAVRTASAEVDAADAALMVAREELVMRQLSRAHAKQRFRDLLDGATAFQSAEVLLRQDKLNQSEAAVSDAHAAAEQAAKLVQERRKGLAAAKSVMDRRSQQLQRLDDHIDRLIAQADEAMSNQEDEEAEETAVARLLAHSREEEALARHEHA